MRQSVKKILFYCFDNNIYTDNFIPDTAGIDAYNYQGVGCPHLFADIKEVNLI